jgi:hypothetical protein
MMMSCSAWTADPLVSYLSLSGRETQKTYNATFIPQGCVPLPTRKSFSSYVYRCTTGSACFLDF